MNSPTPADESEVRALYGQILNAWNKRSAYDFAALFAEDGSVVGFDGSQMNGRAAIEAELQRIFTDHQTATYVGKILEVRFLNAQTAVLRAVSGMIPPNVADINPAVNTIQSLVAAKQDGKWYVALYQNTPAQFHDRPELIEQLTDELRQLLT